MKRVLLNHCVPRRVATALADCHVQTAFREGWGALKNGALLRAAEDAGFQVFVTSDKNLRYQQNLSGFKLAIVGLPSNAIQRLIPILPAIGHAVASATVGSYAEITDAP